MIVFYRYDFFEVKKWLFSFLFVVTVCVICYRVVVVVAHKLELVCNAGVILSLLYPNLSDSLAVCFESGPRESSVNGSHW